MPDNMAETFCDDEDLIAYIKALMGYFMTGNVERQEFYVFWGDGGNGKSKLLNTLRHILGPLCDSMMTSTLFEAQSQSAGYDLASLVGKRLVVASEPDSKKLKLNAALVKQLTGEDQIKVRTLYAKPFGSVPGYKLVIQTNHKPVVDVYDGGLRRRIKLIPFLNIVSEDKRDCKLEDKLKAEASGILNYLLEGVRDYLNGKLKEPEIVRDATEEFFMVQDSVRNFLADKTIKDPNASVAKGTLYDLYKAFCDEEMVEALGKNQFGQVMLNKLGFAEGKNKSGLERIWKGLRVAVPGENERTIYDQWKKKETN
jgi:putative DNA primase/helicase